MESELSEIPHTNLPKGASRIMKNAQPGLESCAAITIRKQDLIFCGTIGKIIPLQPSTITDATRASNFF